MNTPETQPTARQSANSPDASGLDLAEHYRVLTEKLPMPMLIHVAGTLKYLNQACVHLLGGTCAQDFVGTSIMDVIHPDYQAAAFDRVTRILQGEEEVEAVELKLIRLDGRETWIETTGIAVPFAGQQAIYVVGKDIADRKRIEFEKKKRLQEFESLYILTTSISTAQSMEQVFEVAMDALMRLMGADRASILLFGADDRMHFKASRGLSNAYLEAADGHSPWPKGTIEPDPIFIHDIEVDASMSSFRPVAKAEGLRAFGFVPLLHQGQLLGKFMVYFNAPHEFTETDARLAKTVAMHIALAVDRKVTTQELRVAATAFETQEGILVTDAKNAILKVNRAFSRITGYSPADVIGKSPSLLKSGRHDAAFYQQLWDELNQTGSWSGEVWNRRKDASIFPEHLSITAVTDKFQVVTSYVATFTDITQQKKNEQEIHDLAYFDPLTKLANRRLLFERIQICMATSERHAQCGAVLFIDLDFFKTINDTKGHETGDLMLVEVAQRLQSCVRTIDTVSRLGGDEFVVLIETLSPQMLEAANQAEVVAYKIHAALSVPYVLQGQQFHSTPSIGVALFRGRDTSIADLIKHADIAMYQAKAAGRNTVRFFDAETQAALEKRADLDDELHKAINLQQFELHYQIQIRNDRVFGVEALIRWMHPERGMINPAVFIPLAEETGLIIPIGLWVLNTACAQIKAWSDSSATSQLHIAVNVSPVQFSQDNFVQHIEAALFKYAIDPSCLMLELTESMMLSNVDLVIEKMHQIKALGVGFSMDDFGTGFSSLSFLKKLPLDQLKIDQSFVRDLVSDHSDKAIVQAIITMGESFSLNIIAEGVETVEQHARLASLGCHSFQGYLFGRPMPIQQVNASLAHLPEDQLTAGALAPANDSGTVATLD